MKVRERVEENMKMVWRELCYLSQSWHIIYSILIYYDIIVNIAAQDKCGEGLLLIAMVHPF